MVLSCGTVRADIHVHMLVHARPKFPARFHLPATIFTFDRKKLQKHDLNANRGVRMHVHTHNITGAAGECSVLQRAAVY